MATVTIDYEAFGAWATAAGSAATLVAVLVALWQSRSARSDLRRQLRHQNALEERAAEQQLLMGMLDALRQRYETVRDFGIAIANELEDASVITASLRSAVDAFLRASSKTTSALAAHLHLMTALRDNHTKHERADVAATYDNIVRACIYAHESVGNFERWAAQQVDPATFKRVPFDTSPFGKVESTHGASMIAVANRVAALLTPPE